MPEVNDNTPTSVLIVPADLSRWHEPMHTTGDKVWVKVSGQDTADAWSMFESRVPSGLNLPLHVHHEQDEWYWVLEGNFVFDVGGQKHQLSAGMSILSPAKYRTVGRRRATATGNCSSCCSLPDAWSISLIESQEPL